MNLETKITIYKFTPQVFTLTLLKLAIFVAPLGKSMIQTKFRKTMFWAWQVTLSNFQSSAFGAVYQYHSDGR